jgi:hypothetical protein
MLTMPDDEMSLRLTAEEPGIAADGRYWTRNARLSQFQPARRSVDGGIRNDLAVGAV